MDPTNQNTTPPIPTKQHPNGTLLLVISIGVFLLLSAGVYALVSKNKKTNTVTNDQTATETITEKTAELSTDPTSTIAQSGEITTLSVWVDTGGQQVNAVEAILTYPTDTFDFVSIDDTDSAFKIAAESSNNAGTITIARGQIGGISGKQLVGKINLKAKTGGGEGSVTFSDQSKVLAVPSSPEETPSNILNTTSGAKLTVGE